MAKHAIVFGLLLALAGCATMDDGAYRPKSYKEKQAFAIADRSVTPQQVRTNFHGHVETEVAWAGIIKDIRYKEEERVIQVAFQVEHRDFDWTQPIRISAEGQGEFVVGWSARKPNTITHLKSLAKPGDMLIAYGKPYQMKADIIQLAATAVRPIRVKDFTIEVEAPDPQPAP